MHGEELVVGVGLHQVARGSKQFEADEQGEKASDKEEERYGEEIEEGDPFVIRGEQPGPDAIVLVQVILAFGLRHRGWHLIAPDFHSVRLWVRPCWRWSSPLRRAWLQRSI